MPPISNGIFRTYANALLVNNTAILPGYRMDKVTDKFFPDLNLLKLQEKEVASIFSSFGYKPVFINSDELIARGGAIHCVTSHFPANHRKLAKNSKN